MVRLLQRLRLLKFASVLGGRQEPAMGRVLVVAFLWIWCVILGGEARTVCRDILVAVLPPRT